MIFMVRKKGLAKAAGITAVMLAAAVTITGVLMEKAVTTSADTDWGLSFQQEGQAPVTNVTPEFLARYDSWCMEDTKEKNIYLTFDAGYENGYTAGILDVLKKHEVPAAFFLVGNYLETSPELVRRMVDEGHIVGNHTFTHPDMSQIATEESFGEELTKLEAKYKAVTGKEMKKFYRPPQGKYSEANLKLAQKMGYKTVFWSLAYVDWYESDQPSREEAFGKLIPRIHPGAIVLLHSTSQTNAEILDDLLTEWEKMGYSFKSLEELK